MSVPINVDGTHHPSTASKRCRVQRHQDAVDMHDISSSSSTEIKANTKSIDVNSSSGINPLNTSEFFTNPHPTSTNSHSIPLRFTNHPAVSPYTTVMESYTSTSTSTGRVLANEKKYQPSVRTVTVRMPWRKGINQPVPSTGNQTLRNRSGRRK